MTVPCEQEQNIKDIKEDVASVVSSISRMCDSNDRLAKELREMNQTVIKHMVSNREFSLRLDSVEKSVDILFTRGRRADDDIIPGLVDRIKGVEACSSYMKEIPNRMSLVEAWQNKMRGMLLIFPGVCTLIATVASGAAIWIAVTGG